jgi:hypothetical protein
MQCCLPFDVPLISKPCLKCRTEDTLEAAFEENKKTLYSQECPVLARDDRSFRSRKPNFTSKNPASLTGKTEPFQIHLITSWLTS